MVSQAHRNASKLSEHSVPTSQQNSKKAMQVAIAATFTAEPLADSLAFWSQTLSLDCTVTFAPYNQIFQQLLNPTSLLAQNSAGANVVLIRFEDLLPAEALASADSAAAPMEQTVQELISALQSAAAQSATPYLLYVAPASPTAEATYAALFEQLQQQVVSALEPCKGIYVTTADQIAQRYPVDAFYDAKRDSLGHIPYTDLYFTALGSAISRQLSALTRAPYKVIVLDCDNTLWKGVCGEIGPQGIGLDAPWLALQNFMVARSQAGMLLCLCSKNVEEDVDEVFRQRQDMPLKPSHLVSSRINWQPKSENIRSLAQELNLGLDSFIFIDDNPIECSEVRASCPQVLTLQLPQATEKIPQFLEQAWPFDQLQVTEADSQRTQLYKQNIERDRFLQETVSFESFIEGLQLQIEITPVQPEQVARVAQLTQRTNQFNATTVRRSEADIRQFCQSEGDCWVVEVRDRFGDYGLVGVILARTEASQLSVDTFLLSCRVLGRGVEHRMVAHLGQVAVERGLDTVHLPYLPTAKNKPVANFLAAIGKDFEQAQAQRTDYTLPTEAARSLHFSLTQPEAPVQAQSQAQAKSAAQPSAAVSRASVSELWNRIASDLVTPAQILAAVEAQQQRQRSSQARFVPPQTETEKTLAAIWQSGLRIDQVGRQDNFFELGGTSLLAVEVFAQIEDRFGQRLPMTVLLEHPTVEKLAALLDQEDSAADRWRSLVPIQPHGSELPLFFIHGGFGDVLGIGELVKHLGPQQPLYALRGVGLDGQQLPLPTIEAMAAHYIAEIQTVQPHGPYQLVGQCSGGIVVYEMAQQLTQQGEEVALAALLDTPHPQLDQYVLARARYYYHKPSYRHSRFDWSYFLFTANFYRRRLGYAKNYHLEQLKQRDSGERIEYLGSFLNKLTQGVQNKLQRPSRKPSTARDRGSRKPNNSAQPPAPQPAARSGKAREREQLIKDRFFETFVRAQQNYLPKPYPGQLDFLLTKLHTYVPRFYPYQPQSLWANQQAVESVDGLLLGWDRHVDPDRFKLHMVESKHQHLYESPYLENLASVLTSCLGAKPQ